MRETPRPQGTADDVESAHPQLRPGRALAHTTGASGSGTPHRSDGRPPQTPRGVRHTGHIDRLGALPPVPGRSPFSALWFPVLSALCAVLFALATWQVASDGPLLRLDERVGRDVGRPHTPSALAEAASSLGNMEIALPVLAVAICCALWFGLRVSRGSQGSRGTQGSRGPRLWWLPPVAAAAVIGVVSAVVVPMKLWLARPGPLGSAPDYGWYPSGHAATAAVAYGASLLLLLPYVASAAARRGAVAVLLLLNLAVGAGLVRRGYHWPLDVIGSWCLCVPLLWALAALADRARGR